MNALAIAVALTAAVPAGAASPRPAAGGRWQAPFVQNAGQLDRRVAFERASRRLTVFVTRAGEIVHALPAGRRSTPGGRNGVASRGWSVVERFVGARPKPRPGDASPTRVSWFVPADARRWRSGVPTWRSVEMGEPWPGISVVLRAAAGGVEKLFTVAPRADAAAIRIAVRGASRLRRAEDGALVAATGAGEIRMTPPAAWQEVGGVSVPVAAAYVVRGREYGFRLGAHDPERPVVIDPLLQATYAGGSGDDGFDDMAVHPISGDVYGLGSSASPDFPGVSGGAFPTPGIGGEFTAPTVIVRFNPHLTQILQATFFGGTARGIGISPSTGDVYICGIASNGLPGTAGGAQPDWAGGNYDGFAARFDATLTVFHQATYLGGSAIDDASAVAVHPVSGEVYVAGRTDSANFQGTAGGAQTNYGGLSDAFVVRLNPTLTTRLQASYFGGTGSEFPFAFLAMSPFTSDVYVSGQTGSAVLPGLAGGAQTTHAMGSDAYVARFNSALTQVVRSTFFGGDGEEDSRRITVHPATGEVYLAGETKSNNLPRRAGGGQPDYGGGSATGDGFVARFAADLTAIGQSTYLGGGGDDFVQGVAVSPLTGDVYTAGHTFSGNVPGTAGSIQPMNAGDGDALVGRFSASLTTLKRATYLGGTLSDQFLPVAIGANGDVYAGGFTGSDDFPGTAGGAQEDFAGGDPLTGDGLVARLSADLAGGAAADLSPRALLVDPAGGASSDGNGLLEPGETAAVQPAWRNDGEAAVAVSGSASPLTGPPGASYATADGNAAYGSVPVDATASCAAAANCYAVSVSDPPNRPAVHWDAALAETVSPGAVPKAWTLHVGKSFTDVPKSQPFYRKIETIFHNGITVGCAGASYCPAQKVPRSQMAIFIARGIFDGAPLPTSGAVHGAPYNCVAGGTSVFADVLPTDIFCKGVHAIAAQDVTGGCGPSQFCPAPDVTRAEMAIFMAKGMVAPGGGAAVPQAYGPDPVTGFSYSCNPASPSLHFTDVAVSDPFCKHAHFLWAKGVISGCSADAYCPGSDVARDEMAKFLANAFGLELYRP